MNDELKNYISILLIRSASLNVPLKPLQEKIKKKWGKEYTEDQIEDVLISIRADQVSEEVIIYPDDAFQGF